MCYRQPAINVQVTSDMIFSCVYINCMYIILGPTNIATRLCSLHIAIIYICYIYLTYFVYIIYLTYFVDIYIYIYVCIYIHINKDDLL